MTEFAIQVVELSDSFADLWKDLASGLGVALRRIGAANGEPLPSDLAALVLAAGGMERDALEWLDRHEVPLALPVFVVGPIPGVA